MVEDIITEGGRDPLPSSVYIDDIFIYGNNLSEVLLWTEKALLRLAKAGFMINLRKSHIAVHKG